MTITYRQATADDVTPAQRIWESAISDLDKRHGFADQPLSPGLPNPFFAFSLREEPERFWVAEDGVKVVGIGISWVRSSFWFLSYLFVLPSYQGKGVGRALIERTLGHVNKTNFANRALITLAYNPVSISLYMHYEMYPREPLYWMSGPREAIQSALQRVEPFDYEKLSAKSNDLKHLSHIDQHVLGFSLGKHHDFLLNSQNTTCYLFRKDGVPEGYTYIHSEGPIGPLAVKSPSSFRRIMNTSLRLAATQNVEKLSFIVAGSNKGAIEIALNHKMRIDGLFLLMSSEPFGNWATYLFHSPWLM